MFIKSRKFKDNQNGKEYDLFAYLFKVAKSQMTKEQRSFPYKQVLRIFLQNN